MHLSFRRKKFYFIRHGETRFNKEKRYTGLFDLSLNSDGVRQVENSLDILKIQNISLIYSSPLKRALETAHLISSYLNIPIIIINEFKERDFGSFQTRKKFNYKKKYFPNAQTLYKHRRETLIGFNKINIDNNVLIVAHSGTYKALSKYLLNLNVSKSIDNALPICFFQDNTKTWKVVDLKI